MTRLVDAELLKLRTTRGAWVYLVSLVLLVAIGVASTVGAAPDASFDDRLALDALAVAATSSIFALLLGITGFTGEFRHGTITQTFLVEPVRERVLASKLLAYALAGLLFALVSTVVTLAMAVPWLEARGVDPALGERESLLVLVGSAASTVLWGALGVSVGAIVRNQVFAIVAVLIWILVAENLLSAFLEEVAPYLPGRASSGMIGSSFMDDDLSRTAGTLVTVAYLAGFTALAAVFLRRRDAA